MREFFTTGCVSFRTERSKEISEASLGNQLWPMLSHAAASRPPGLAAERGDVAPRPAADAAGCKEIAAPRLYGG